MVAQSGGKGASEEQLYGSGSGAGVVGCAAGGVGGRSRIPSCGTWHGGVFSGRFIRTLRAGGHAVFANVVGTHTARVRPGAGVAADGEVVSCAS